MPGPKRRRRPVVEVEQTYGLVFPDGDLEPLWLVPKITLEQVQEFAASRNCKIVLKTITTTTEITEL